MKGIEPSYSAWKAAALPLSYTRMLLEPIPADRSKLLAIHVVRSVIPSLAVPSMLFAAPLSSDAATPEPGKASGIVTLQLLSPVAG